MTHGIGMANKHFGGAAHRCNAVLPHPKRFEQDLAFVVGEVVKSAQRISDRFHHHLGAATAAVARIEPSNTATGEAWGDRPRIITLAKCSACGVSRRSSKRALIPTRFVATRDTKPKMSSSRSDLTCTIPTCRSGWSRHAEYTSRPRSFDSISGNACLPTAGTSAAMTTNGPLA